MPHPSWTTPARGPTFERGRDFCHFMHVPCLGSTPTSTSVCTVVPILHIYRTYVRTRPSSKSSRLQSSAIRILGSRHLVCAAWLSDIEIVIRSRLTWHPRAAAAAGTTGHPHDRSKIRPSNIGRRSVGRSIDRPMGISDSRRPPRARTASACRSPSRGTCARSGRRIPTWTGGGRGSEIAFFLLRPD